MIIDLPFFLSVGQFVILSMHQHLKVCSLLLKLKSNQYIHGLESVAKEIQALKYNNKVNMDIKTAGNKHSWKSSV